MKTERRHDLETNELAVRITGWIEKFKPYTGQMVGGAIVLLGIAIVSSIWSSQSVAKRRAGWDEFAIAHDTTDPELLSLRRVADKEDYAGTPMQEWAYVTWADRQVLLASAEYLINRKSAKDRLRQVEGIYEGAATGASDTVVQNRARFGLARVYELQNKLDDARKQYSLVQGDLQPIASQRAEQLDSPEIQKTCAWLATAELPQRSTAANSGEPRSRPNFDAAIPDATPSNESLEADLPAALTLEDILKATHEGENDDARYSSEKSEANTEEKSADEPEKAEASADEESANEPEKAEASTDEKSATETDSEKP